MHIQIAGKHIDLGDSLRSRIEAGLEAAVTKYFDRPSEGHVTVSKDGYQTRVDCSVHLPSGIILQAQGSAAEPYAALEDALEKMEKRVRRYKRRLKDHHRPGRAPMPSEDVSAFVIQSLDEETDDIEEAPAENGTDTQPLIIAEMAEKLRTMSVSEAVMQLELGEAPVVFFRHATLDRLNLVYRRPDGNIGWVDPTSSVASSS
ncbi:MAG: ribosome-associated translation inhibitor RaiA [Pseudomonadota bacterium]